MGQRYQLPIPFGWYAVALSSEVEVGDVKPVHYFGEELVVFRTESGEAKVLDAYCPHLGAHLGHGGTVSGENVRCPFHAWEFDGTGMCRNVPYAKNIPPKVKDKPCIYAYPVIERNQAIWAWYHPEKAAPSFDVTELDEFASKEWTDIHVEEWVIDSIIQETSENGVDAAHFTYVHQSKEVPAGEVKYDGPERHAFFESQTPDIDEDGNFDETGTKWRTSYLNTSSVGPGQTYQRFTGLFETLMQGTVTPINDEQTHLRFMFTQPADQTELRQVMADALRDNVTSQVQQDIPIWNNKAYRESPVLCDGDGPIAKHRKWFSQFYHEQEAS